MPKIHARNEESKRLLLLRNNQLVSYENFRYFLCNTVAEYNNN